LPLDEAEAEEIADAIAIAGDRRVPVEGFERLLFLEAGAREALAEIVLIAAVDLVLEGELEELQLGELALAGVGDAVGERGQDAGEFEALEDRLEGGGDIHGQGSFRSTGWVKL